MVLSCVDGGSALHDLLIKGGRVIDPARGLDGIMDVAVRGRAISKLGRDIPAAEASEVIDASGKVVSPGLVDLHAHVYRHGDYLDADELCGVWAGVTSIVDAGSVGAAEFADFRDEVVRPIRATVYGFLYNHWWPSGYEPEDEIHKDRHIDIDGIVELAGKYPDIVKGVKVAVTPPIRRKYGLAPIVRGREAARAAGIRLMLHVGDISAPTLESTPSEVTAEALDLLDPGDILTHVFSPLTGGGLDEDGRVLPAFRAAKERGVVMDAAIGDYQFSWEAAEKVLAEGILPDVISSDIEIHSGPAASAGVMVRDRRVTGERVAAKMTLVEYMAYFLELGFAVEDIVRMTSTTPARAADIGSVAGTLEEGRPADISVLEVLSGRFALTDVTGVTRVGERAIAPVVTIKEGRVYEPGRGAHDWGFAPPAAAG